MSSAKPPGMGLVLLAAGSSERMGTPKQLLDFDGQTFLRRAASEALESGCGPVVVVLGAYTARLTNELEGLAVMIVENQLWREGMGTSIRTGIEALVTSADGDAVAGAVIAVCDQPFFSSAFIRELVARHAQWTGPATAAEYGGVRGVPAVFGRALFPELLRLDGSHGARRILEAHAHETLGVPFAGGAIDIDTPEDYAQLTRQDPTLAKRSR